MKEEAKEMPSTRTWDKEVSGTEKKRTERPVKSNGMGGATGCESPNTLQHRKFGKHGPE